MASGLTALTTTHRVVYRVHHNTTVVGAATEPAAAAGRTGALEGMVGVADNADSGATRKEHLAGFS